MESPPEPDPHWCHHNARGKLCPKCVRVPRYMGCYNNAVAWRKKQGGPCDWLCEPCGEYKDDQDEEALKEEMGEEEYNKLPARFVHPKKGQSCVACTDIVVQGPEGPTQVNPLEAVEALHVEIADLKTGLLAAHAKIDDQSEAIARIESTVGNIHWTLGGFIHSCREKLDGMMEQLNWFRWHNKDE